MNASRKELAAPDTSFIAGMRRRYAKSEDDDEHAGTPESQHVDTQAREQADTQAGQHVDTQAREQADTQAGKHADTPARQHAGTPARQKADGKQARQHADKPAGQQADKPTRQRASKQAGQRAGTSARQQASTPKPSSDTENEETEPVWVNFSTYLPEQLRKDLRIRCAVLDIELRQAVADAVTSWLEDHPAE